MSNQRKAPRYIIGLTVTYGEEHNYQCSRVTDLSEGGMFIETISPFPEGAVIKIKPVFGYQFNVPQIDGRVVYCIRTQDSQIQNHPPGMGIQFENLTDNDRSILQELLRRIQEAQAAAE